MILSFAGYSFCKGHSCSYIQVAQQSAYLRANHPAEFIAAVLSNAELRKMCDDTGGRYFDGNAGGLAVRDPGGRWRALGRDEGFTARQVFFIGQDRDGVIWVGVTMLFVAMMQRQERVEWITQPVT